MKKIKLFLTIILLLPQISYSAYSTYVIGDLHGDLDVAINLLRKAKLIDGNNNWIGNGRVLIQTGDQIDRGPDDKLVLDFFESLDKKATKFGGRVYSLIGNHELMNVKGQMKYTIPQADKLFSCQNAPPLKCREKMFHPGGEYARMLSNRKSILIYNGYVFLHGGLRLRYIAGSKDPLAQIEKMNQEMSLFLQGKTPIPAGAEGRDNKDQKDNPFWDRTYSKGTPSADTCRELSQVLSLLKAKAMVLGHSIQKQGINTACNNQVFRIDVGMSKGFYINKKSIQSDEVTGEIPANQRPGQMLKIQDNGSYTIIQ